MILHPALIAHVEPLLAEVLKFTLPADVVTSRYFKAHPQLGHRDRGVVAEAVFAVLRHKLEFAQFAQSGSGTFERRLALLGLAYVAGMPAVIAKVGPEEKSWLDRISQVARTSLPFEARCNLPDWLMTRMRAVHSDPEIERLCNALNRPAPLDLRVNVMKINRDAALLALNEAGIEATATPYAPLGIRLAGKPALQHVPLFIDGSIEVQDEGSQILAHLVAPRRGEMVIDFCAGAGGKTLALGALMRSSGRLYAMDVSAKRLAKLKPRLARSGLSNVHPMALESERDSRLKRMAKKADRVLVDAPCSGLGTLRRNPDLKWRQSASSVYELCDKQSAILSAASRLVKPGGRLVYATCSLLEAENGAIADEFLKRHPEFVAVDVNETLRSQQIVMEMGPRFVLSPEIHGTDGFFAAIFERAA